MSASWKKYQIEIIALEAGCVHFTGFIQSLTMLSTTLALPCLVTWTQLSYDVGLG